MKRIVVQESPLSPMNVRHVFDSTFLMNGRQVCSEFFVSFERAIALAGAHRREKSSPWAYEGYVLHDDGSQELAHYERARPYIYLTCADGWLVHSLFQPETEMPAQFRFAGPSVGFIARNEGYAAASDGPGIRSITSLTVTAHLTLESLSFKIDLTAGPIQEGTGQRCVIEDHQPVTFEIEFTIPVEFVPEVVRLGRYDRQFSNRLAALGKQAPALAGPTSK